MKIYVVMADDIPLKAYKDPFRAEDEARIQRDSIYNKEVLKAGGIHTAIPKIIYHVIPITLE